MIRHMIAFTALLFMLAVTWWGFGEQEVALETADESTEMLLTAYASDFIILSTNDEGVAEFQLEASTGRYYEDKDLWQIDEPRWHMFPEDEPPWVGSAAMGQSWANGEEAELIGDVELTQQLPDGSRQLTSERFFLRPKAHYAETDDPVRLTGPTYTISAVGARTWLDEKRTELLNEVRGQHD